MLVKEVVVLERLKPWTTFADTIRSLGRRTFDSPLLADEVADVIVSITHFKASKQLYSTLSDPEKSVLQPLKAVFYDSNTIPDRICGSLSMVGNIDSKLGIIKVKNNCLLFKRWIVLLLLGLLLACLVVISIITIIVLETVLLEICVTLLDSSINIMEKIFHGDCFFNNWY